MDRLAHFIGYAVICGTGVWILFRVVSAIPVRRATLIEGVYERSGQDTELFSGKELRVFWFENLCRSCREKGQQPLYGQCHACVPRYANYLGGFPRRGDKVKLIGWKNVFGRVLLYYFQPVVEPA